jgi:hypothetical protein
MNSLTITISDIRAIDGWVEAANRAGLTPEAMANLAPSGPTPGMTKGGAQ